MQLTKKKETRKISKDAAPQLGHTGALFTFCACAGRGRAEKFGDSLDRAVGTTALDFF